MDVKDRIIQFIEFKGVSINAFEKSIGASKSYISNTKNISAEVASNILLIYSDLSAEWLLTGEGEMIKPSVPHAGRSDIHTSYTGTFTKPIITDIRNVSGNGNTVIGNGNISGGNNAMPSDHASPSSRKKSKTTNEISMEMVDQRIEIERLKAEIERLNVRLELKESIIENKDLVIKEKERVISLLMEKK